MLLEGVLVVVVVVEGATVVVVVVEGVIVVVEGVDVEGAADVVIGATVVVETLFSEQGTHFPCVELPPYRILNLSEPWRVAIFEQTAACVP